MIKKIKEFFNNTWNIIHSIEGKDLLSIYNIGFFLVWLYMIIMATIDLFVDSSFIIGIILSPLILGLLFLVYMNFRLYPFATAWLGTFRALRSVYGYNPGILNYIKSGINRTKHAYRNTNLDIQHYIDVFGFERVERRGKQGKRSNAIWEFGNHFFLTPLIRLFTDFIFIWPLSFLIGSFGIYRLKRKR